MEQTIGSGQVERPPELDSTYYWRQLDIIDYNELKNTEITMIGVGGLGSPTAMVLSKMGVHKLTIYDPDVVDRHNVPNQMFGVNDIGDYKVDAISKIVANYGSEVAGKKELFENQSLSGVVIVSVDNMKAREEIWKRAKFSPRIPLFIDMRMGAEIGRIFTVNPTDPASIKEYEATLYSDEEAVEEPCTARAIIYNTFSMASWVGKIIRNYVMKEHYPKQIYIDMSGWRMFAFPEF